MEENGMKVKKMKTMNEKCNLKKKRRSNERRKRHRAQRHQIALNAWARGAFCVAGDRQTRRVGAAATSFGASALTGRQIPRWQ